MPLSDDYGSDNDDTAFLAAATQVEASQQAGFEASNRPAKRRRIRRGPTQLDGHSSDELESYGSNDEASSPEEKTSAHCGAVEEERTASDDEPVEDRDYYFPGELIGEDERLEAAKQSKYKIHIPKDGGQFQDQIFTQTQAGLDSSPGQFRGAVWKRPKPPTPPPPAFGQGHVNGNARLSSNGGAASRTTVQRQVTLNGFNLPVFRPGNGTYHSDANLAARLQADENALSMQRQNSANKRPIEPSEELADLPSDAFSSSSPEKLPVKVIIEISSQTNISQARPHAWRGPQNGLKQMTIFGQPATQDLAASQAATKKHAWPLKSKEEPPTHHKLDDKAMETWVYPTNLGTIRDYQYNIVARSLFHNTLVALPTGLGKTFIAATVMLNYYRWTKDAQIVFMAPTKPLIAQQMEACYHIVGIPRSDTVLMTGETQPALRAEEWLQRRVFFMTPQTVINDLKTGISDPKRFVLVVVDEAHKATGSYAYTEVVSFLRRFNSSFRVLALTATPGSTTEAVQAVVDHLGIARVELRTEQSLDIRQYTFEKNIDEELFEFSDEQVLIMEHMSKALKPVLEKLCTQNAYWSRDPMQLTSFGLLTARKKYMASDAGRKAAISIKGMVNSIFTVLQQIANSLSLLKFHGIGPFHNSVREFMKSVESGETKGKYATQIAQSQDFTKAITLIRGWTNNPDFIGHPKLEYLREVVLNHFLDAGEGRQGSDVPPSATRVMVFTSYRDSTEEICRVLKRNEPMIRPHVFVGQAASKDSEGMNQKRQNEVIKDFRSGKYNTLVATSIGEEGLDIGDVDLIVNYDASTSPIRMLQRIGRTGRKRVGRVVLLLMKNKEQADYAKAQDAYSYIQKTIADTKKYTYRDDQSPRILPKGAQPVVDKRMIEIPVENSQPIDLNEKGRRAKGKAKLKRPPKKFHMPDGVKTGFVKASKMDSSDHSNTAEDMAPKKKAPAKKEAPPAIAKAVPPEPEVERVQLPYLEDVLLTRLQQADLERKYAHGAGDDDDAVVRAPDARKYPESFRVLGPTKYVRHGYAARAVERSMDGLKQIGDAQVTRMKEIGAPDDLLKTSGDACSRLVSPTADHEESDDELPAVPIAKKPSRGRPKKAQPVQRTASMQSTAAVAIADSPDVSAPRKQRGRPRKNNTAKRSTSYASAAAEGDESSPEPTPAHLRIGTQGIDLGSRDTSGEDNDEEADSELDEFIVRSDQPIEMASSSQRLPDDTQPPRPAGSTRRKPKEARAPAALFSDDNDDDMASDLGLADVEATDDDDSDEIQEVAAPQAVTGAASRKKRRVIDDSDTE